MPCSLESQKSSNMARSCELTAPSSHPNHLISSFKSSPLYFAGTGRPSPRASRFAVAQLFVSAITRHFPAAEYRSHLSTECHRGRELRIAMGTSDTSYSLYYAVVVALRFPHHHSEQLSRDCRQPRNARISWTRNSG